MVHSHRKRVRAYVSTGKNILAVYHVRFFELDQTIAAGDRKDYEFYLDPHFSEVTSLEIVPSGMLLVFHNSLSDVGRRLVLDCTIKRIHHLEFGDVLRIDTHGFEYRIETGKVVIVVDAEERAGEVYSGGIEPKGWLFTVEVDVHRIVRLK